MAADFVVLAVAIVLAIAVLAAMILGITTLLWFGVQLASIPGIVVHEFAHKKACDLVGVPVLEVVYFRFGTPSGYVRHTQPDRYRESFVISVAPFLVNTVVSMAAFLGLAALVTAVGTEGAPPGELLAAIWTASRETLALAVVLCWLGLSVGMQAFPSTGDANTLWTRSRSEWRRSPVVLLAVPFVLVIYVANLLSWLWADVLYAVGLGIVAFYAVGAFGV
ncbi:metalloprotease family protein [Natronorubrum halophilum]|uniref:metalloprotease family protein n=1 Tax=Natronorubrum halophilum TaxID=1702106 RepID=UPI0010C20CBE|nr:metalloprotease family protein [Natronorubrum halophilum]